jgi:hypothetical protein
MTEDTHWMTKGTPFKARFPKKEYIRVLMEYLLTEDSMLVTKSREMMASWTVTGYISWSCMTQPLFWIAQTAKQDKAAELIEYSRILYNNQDEWLKRKNPLIVDNEMELRWANGGRFLGLPSGADQVRMYHAYGYFQDESAFLPEAQEAHDAVRPVVKQFIGVSTDLCPSWFHDMTKLEE